MTRVAVADASVLVAVITDVGAVGEAAAGALADRDLHVPHLTRYEVLQVLRRLEQRDVLAAEVSAEHVRTIVEWPLTQWGLDHLWGRVWQLRSNCTVYDATYVALAEHLDAPLITLDRRLGRAPGVRCEVIVPS